MNLSSVVITAVPNADLDALKKEISKYSSIEASQNDKIVAVIESDDTNGQIASFRALERIEGVAHVAMIYNYEDPADAGALGSRSMDEIMENLENTPVDKVKYGGHPGI